MEKKIIVVKYGSASVTNQNGMDQAKLRLYARQIAHEYAVGTSVIVVSSGAVATGRALWHEIKCKGIAESDQPFAMLGSAGVVDAWRLAFKEHGILAGQLLVTHREVDDREEGQTLRASLRRNLKYGIVTIVNENDALSDQELAQLAYGGDNDGLANHIACSMNAAALYLFTNSDGLIGSDGHVIRTVFANKTARTEARRVAGSAGDTGRGGMKTKVAAALAANAYGITAYIAKAGTSVKDVASGAAGTYFVAKSSVKL